MDRGRAKFEPPVRVAASGSVQTTRPPRANRLSRSFRLTQTVPAAELDSHRSQRVPEFKTPNRTPRTKPAPVFCGASPHNDSDFQQDIIWDATSPSPRRPRKRGKQQTSRVVNISEIVSRIAPKNGRPQAAEPSLQQWIGDSATIPCTPDIQTPRTRRKSPRASSVEDLLRLAKRFDQNMFHQDEEEMDSLDLQNLDLLPQNILDFQNTHQSKLSASLSENRQLAVSTAPETDLNRDKNCQLAVNAAPETDPDLDQQLQDDLDFLFDGPTQNLSWNLSHSPSAPSEDYRKLPESLGSVSARGAFEDDWEKDDLLNDLLMLEMTQNPLNFIAPKRCSTQKPSGPIEPSGPGRPVSQREQAASVRSTGRVAPSVRPRVQKENLGPRAMFRLESNPGFSGSRTQTDQQVDCRSSDSQLSGSPSVTGLHQTEPTCQTNSLRPDPQRSQMELRSSAETFKSNVVDFMDLDFLFSSDPVWGDPADDYLLCKMCEDLENQNQNINTKQTPVLSNHRAALQPTHRTCTNRIQAGAGGSSGPGGVAGVSGSRAAPRPENSQRAGRTNNPVTMTTTKGKCSAAEIELKKQQALERRYQRLQAQQNRPGIS